MGGSGEFTSPGGGGEDIVEFETEYIALKSAVGPEGGRLPTFNHHMDCLGVYMKVLCVYVRCTRPQSISTSMNPAQCGMGWVARPAPCAHADKISLRAAFLLA